MTAALRRWALSRWAAVLALLLVAVAVTLFIVSIVSANNYQRCVARWADQFTHRTVTLSAASAARNNALDVFIRSLATRNEAQELVAYNSYLHASDVYTQELKANPPPTPPKLRC